MNTPGEALPDRPDDQAPDDQAKAPVPATESNDREKEHLTGEAQAQRNREDDPPA